MDYENVNENTYKDLGLTNKIQDVVDYDVIDNSSPNNQIVGKMHKKFVRMNSGYFKRYFELRKKGNVSFSTYFSEEDERMNYIPNLVSTLIKQTASSRDRVFETYAPEVLNFFNSQTVFNSLCQDDKGFSYVASIDFIKQNEKLVLFSEVGGYCEDFGYEVDLQSSLKYVTQTIKKIYQEENIDLTENKMKSHLEEFVKSYLVRICLLKDKDFSVNNNGFLINDKEKSIRYAPNFDFDFAFIIKEYNSLKDDLIFGVNNFPDVVDEFMKNLTEFTKKKDGVEVYKHLYDEVKGTDRYRDFIFDVISGQSKQIKEEYENIKGFRFEWV